MAETKFNEFIIPSVMGAGYTTEGIIPETGITTLDGGYCQIGNIVIVQYKFTISGYTGGSKTFASGFPPVMRPGTELYGYLCSNRSELHPYISDIGELRTSGFSTAVDDGTTASASGIYLTTAPSIYIPPAFEVPVPINLAIVPEMQSYCSIYRNNSYKLGRIVQISIVMIVTQAIADGPSLLISNNPPVLYRDPVSDPQLNTGIVDIPSWNDHRIRVTPSGIVLTGPLDANQYTFSGMYIARE